MCLTYIKNDKFSQAQAFHFLSGYFIGDFKLCVGYACLFM